MRFAALVVLAALSVAVTADNQPDFGSGSLVVTTGDQPEAGRGSFAVFTDDQSGPVHDFVTVTTGDVPAGPVTTSTETGPANKMDHIVAPADEVVVDQTGAITTSVEVDPADETAAVTISAEVDSADVVTTSAKGDPADEIDTVTLSGDVEPADQKPAIKSSPDDWLAKELDSFCHRIDEKLSSVDHVECVRIGLLDDGAASNKDTPLLYKDIAAGSDQSTARVLLVGGVHGDEYSSVSIVFKWLAMLEEDLGDRFHWRVIPVLNPDGLLRPPRMSSRMNANGVDLNRNFPTPNWEAEAHAYWIKKTLRNERRYPGPAPLSEPETAWLVQQIESFQPHAVVSVHAPHGVVDFDGPRVPPRQLGPLELRLLGTYPGSMGRYIGIHKGIPLLTLELESAFGMPATDEVYDIWYDMIGWLHEKIALPLKLAEESEVRAPAELIRVRPAADEG